MRSQRTYVMVLGLVLFTGVLAVSSTASAGLWDKKPKAPAAKSDAPAKAADAKQPMEDGKVAYTFTDDTKLEEFARLWQQRQRGVLRMTVLQSYWNEEQQALGALNEQFAKEYSLDLKKNYRFDPDRKVLIEVEGSPASAAATPTTSPRPAAPPSTQQ